MEALIEWAWPPTEASEERAERAWELVDAIADTQGLPPDELINQVDDGWNCIFT